MDADPHEDRPLDCHGSRPPTLSKRGRPRPGREVDPGNGILAGRYCIADRATQCGLNRTDRKLLIVVRSAQLGDLAPARVAASF
jgi:hypothetical protein